VDGAADVTPRYVRNFHNWGAARDRTTEAVLVYILDEIRLLRRKAMLKKEKTVLQGEDMWETKELRGYIAKALADELCKSVIIEKGEFTSTASNSRKELEAMAVATRKYESSEPRRVEDQELRNLQ
jgi:hypothetical protein